MQPKKGRGYAVSKKSQYKSIDDRRGTGPLQTTGLSTPQLQSKLTNAQKAAKIIETGQHVIEASPSMILAGQPPDGNQLEKQTKKARARSANYKDNLLRRARN